MRSSSRYLATVRRAIWIPSARSRCMMRASEKGRRASSSCTIREILFLMDSDETSSPDEAYGAFGAEARSAYESGWLPGVE